MENPLSIINSTGTGCDHFFPYDHENNLMVQNSLRFFCGLLISCRKTSCQGFFTGSENTSNDYTWHSWSDKMVRQLLKLFHPDKIDVNNMCRVLNMIDYDES